MRSRPSNFITLNVSSTFLRSFTHRIILSRFHSKSSSYCHSFEWMKRPIRYTNNDFDAATAFFKMVETNVNCEKRTQNECHIISQSATPAREVGFAGRGRGRRVVTNDGKWFSPLLTAEMGGTLARRPGRGRSSVAETGDRLNGEMTPGRNSERAMGITSYREGFTDVDDTAKHLGSEIHNDDRPKQHSKREAVKEETLMKVW